MGFLALSIYSGGSSARRIVRNPQITQIFVPDYTDWIEDGLADLEVIR